MNPVHWPELRAAIGRAEALLCDWDGCLAIGDRLLPRVADILMAGPPFAIVSNNSTMPRAAYRAMLAAQGLVVEDRHIHLAGDTLLREAARLLGRRAVEVVGTPAMRGAARDLRLNLVDHQPDTVLLLRDTGFDFATLERIANHVRDGASLWIANPDASHPVNGGVSPETGALAAAIAAIAGRSPDRVIGKPMPLLFQHALASLDVPADRAVMIGDNPVTDIAGAEVLGIRGCLVNAQSWGNLAVIDLAARRRRRAVALDGGRSTS